jgi:hypothetical protein
MTVGVQLLELSTSHSIEKSKWGGGISTFYIIKARNMATVRHFELMIGKFNVVRIHTI